MSAFEITFLGTGTSVGIPVIGCDCEVCRSTDPLNKRTRASIHVNTPGCAWIVDAGPDIRQQILRENIRRIDAVLISHTHTDHIMGLDDLRRFTLGREGTMPVYATAPSMDVLKTVFSFAFNGQNRYYSYFKPDPREITGDFHLGETTVIPLPVLHGSVDTIGFLFETRGVGAPLRVAYISDCKEFSPEAEAKMGGLDVLIVDALRYSSHPTHMNVEESLEFSRRIGAKKVWFTHISCEIDHRSGEKRLPGHVRIAYDGLKLHF